MVGHILLRKGAGALCACIVRPGRCASFPPFDLAVVNLLGEFENVNSNSSFSIIHTFPDLSYAFTYLSK